MVQIIRGKKEQSSTVMCPTVTRSFPQINQTPHNPFQPRSNSLNGCLSVFKRNVTGLATSQESHWSFWAITHTLKTNNMSTNYMLTVKSRSVAWNDQSVWWSNCYAVKRGDELSRETRKEVTSYTGAFSLPSSQAGHRAAFGWTRWIEKQLLLLVESSGIHDTHLYARLHSPTHTHTQSWR